MVVKKKAKTKGGKKVKIKKIVVGYLICVLEIPKNVKKKKQSDKRYQEHLKTIAQFKAAKSDNNNR